MNNPRDPIVVATYAGYIEANLARLRLEDEGIEASIEDQNLISIDPLLVSAIDGVKLRVRAEDSKAAIAILKAHAQAVADIPLHCPRCDSTDVARGWHFAFFSLLWIPFPVGASRRWLRCKACKHAWRENP